MLDKINFGKKVVVTAAVTGSITTKKQNPYLPMTPQEVAEECYQAMEMGAAIAHIHPRHPDPDLTDLEVFNETVALVRQRCGDMIIQVGTGVRSRFNEIRKEEERLVLLEISPKPDMATINAGTFHYQSLAKNAPEKTGRNYLFNNPPELVEAFVTGFKERDIKIEFEAWDAGQIWDVLRLVEKGMLTPEELHINFVMGIGGAMPATLKMLTTAADMMPPKSHWTAMAPGRDEFPLCAVAAVMGGNVRVGLEDNVYLSHNVLAKGNGPIVEKMVRIIRDLGKDVATAAEAREMMNIPLK